MFFEIENVYSDTHLTMWVGEWFTQPISGDKTTVLFWSEELYLDYSVWYEYKEQLTDKEESTDKEELTDVPPIPPLEGDEEEAKEGKGFKIFNSKEIINQSANIISTNKSWKEFMQIKKWNQTNTVPA